MRNIIKLVFVVLLFVTACTRTAEPIFESGSIFAPSTPSTISQPQQESSGINHPVGKPEALQESSGIFGGISRGEPMKIAILLPLSGRFKEVGKNMLDAAQMSLFGINDANITLIPIDTKETEADAVDAANQAIEQGAKLILGPVFSRSAQAIIPIAKQHNINVVAFSNDKTLAGSGIFTLGFIPEQQLARVLNYSTAHGVTDYTTMVPNNTYGGTTVKRLREHTQKDSVSAVIKSEIFQIDKEGKPQSLEDHFSALYKAAMSSRSPRDYDSKRKKYNDNPIKYPRALLLPDGGETLKQIGSLLQQKDFDKSKIQLLGTSQWYSTDVLNNPVFEGAWVAAPERGRREQFEEKFFSSYNYKPASVTSLAYDAVALAATIASQGRGEFSVSDLTNPRGFIGVDGIFRLRPDGLTERGLAIMTIKSGKFEVLDPAPKSFSDISREEIESYEEEIVKED